MDSPTQEQHHLAAIALGSNLGDRFANIEAALRLLERPEDFSSPQEQGTSSSLTVVNTSFLYETAPMYVTDQPSFLNCACIVRSVHPFACTLDSQSEHSDQNYHGTPYTPGDS
jgi:dihydroneopterin aldolase/2-amino-4-hydroxy-6-hydroxymethyldihydropteridine diphosphokinase/dihydropteroate synthase